MKDISKLKDYNKNLLKILKGCVDVDNNAEKFPARFTSYLAEELDNFTNLEIACVALLGGFKVYECNYGFYGELDYLVMLPQYSLEKFIKHCKDNFYEDLCAEDFKECKSLEDLF